MGPNVGYLFFCGVFLFCAVMNGNALGDELSPGTYQCSSYNVSGGGGSCRSFQPLVLYPDGKYKFSSTYGRWNCEGGKLRLSESKLWGQGEILGSDTVRFQYDYRGFHHVVTWTCRECTDAPAKKPDPSKAKLSTAKGSHVGVTLKLDFDRSASGVSSFTIVPAESAAGYGHNAPLPGGAVQGLAWESGPTSVSLATNRNNKLMSGRRYVVFLSWPAETIPVAVLDLPPVKSDYTAALPATLDGTSILRAAKQPAVNPAAQHSSSVELPTAPDKPAPWMMGLRLGDLTQTQASYLGMRKPFGALVLEVIPGSAAQGAGILAGDVITHIDGKPVANMREVQQRTQARRMGRSTRVGLIRVGEKTKRMELDVPAFSP